MPGNRALLEKCLGELGLAPRREEEILRELADHLEDHAAALKARGITNEEAFQEALSGVADWPEFREEIFRAETEEATMNYQVTYRAKVLWLPALGALTLSSVLLALLQFSGLVPRFYWLSPDLSMGAYFTFYVPWLIALPIVGAAAARWSQCAGGKAVHRLLASLATPVVLLGFLLIGAPIAFLFDHVAHNIQAASFLTYAVSWVLFPAVALFLGATPFLRRRQPQD